MRLIAQMCLCMEKIELLNKDFKDLREKYENKFDYSCV